MGLNFKIVDGDDYYDKYDEFIEYYNNEEYGITRIREELGLSSNKYRDYRRKGLRENKIISRSNSNVKYYTRFKDKYTVWKSLNGHNCYFGIYDTEEEAQDRVRELENKGWKDK